jgi:hypothetical protein
VFARLLVCSEVEADDFGTHKSFMGVDGQAAKMKKRANLSQQPDEDPEPDICSPAGSQAYKEVTFQKEARTCGIRITARMPNE